MDWGSILVPLSVILGIKGLEGAGTKLGQDMYETAKRVIARLIKLNNKQAEPFLNRLNGGQHLLSHEMDTLLMLLDNMSINAVEIDTMREERINLKNTFYDILMERLDFQQVRNVSGRLGLTGLLPDRTIDELSRGIINRISANQRFDKLVDAIIRENPNAFH